MKLPFIKRVKLSFLVLDEIQKNRLKRKEEEKFIQEAIKEEVHFSNPILYKLIELYDRQYPMPRLRDLFIALLQTIDKYEFQKHSSVAFAYESFYKEHKNRYDLLKQINLLTHTINVFNISLKEQDRSLPEQIREEVSILAIAHDFGKCADIKKIFSSTEAQPHNHISAEFLRRLMHNLGSFDRSQVDRLCHTIHNHHKSKDDKTQGQESESLSFFINALNAVDHKAREFELDLLKDKNFTKKEGEAE